MLRAVSRRTAAPGVHVALPAGRRGLPLRGKLWPAVLVFAGLLAAGPGSAPAQAEDRGESWAFSWGEVTGDIYRAGERVDVRDSVGGDVVAAGGQVSLDADIAGLAIVAGGQVSVGHTVRGDILAAGGQLDIGGEAGDDVRAAGGSVTVRASIAGDLLAAGGQVAVESPARIEGYTRMAGGDLSFGGAVAGDLHATGESVRVFGEVGGTATLHAEHVEIGPTARIAGNLDYRSPEPAKIHPAAQIGGEVIYTPGEAHAARPAEFVGWAILQAAILIVGLLAAMLVLERLFPTFARGAVATLGQRRWPSFFLGFALIFAIPAAAVFLLVILIGIPLGLAVGLLYPIALVLGYLTTVRFLADGAAVRLSASGRPGPAARALWSLAMLVLLGLIALVPLLGGVVVFVATALGLGALALQARRAHAGGGVAGRRF